MEERKKVSVDDWIAKPQHLRHRERKEIIRQWVTVVGVVGAILAFMVFFGKA